VRRTSAAAATAAASLLVAPLLSLAAAGCHAGAAAVPATAAAASRPAAAPRTAAAAAGIDTAALLASARPEIDAANAAWLPGLRRHDAAAIVAAYADSGVFVTAQGEAIRGREAIAAMYASRFPLLGAVVGGDVVQEGLAVVGDRIYEWGHATVELAGRAAGDPPRRAGGSYLTVWERDAAGHWRIVRNLSL